MKKLSFTLTLIVGGMMSTLTSSAQVIYSDAQDHAYNNMILVDDPNMQYPAGYLMATTKDYGAGIQPVLTRVDAQGALLWQQEYSDPDISDFRITKVTKVTHAGSLAFLFTGSCKHSSNGFEMAYLALVNEGGDPLAIEVYDISNFSLSIGLDCIEASDGNYVLVGMNMDGWSAVDSKEGFFLKVNGNNLANIIAFDAFDSPNTLGSFDYDMAESVTETIDSEHYFITGLSNNTNDHYSAALALHIHCGGGPGITKLWEQTFETTYLTQLHWDNGADAHYDGTNIWLLANNSVRHMSNLTKFDINGNLLFHTDIDDQLLNYEYYGFELIESNNTPGDLCIAGWNIKDVGGFTYHVRPFVLEYQVSSNTFISQAEMMVSNTGYDIYAENFWLAPFAGSQMPLFTPDLVCKRVSAKPGGYALTAIENSSSYDPALVATYSNLAPQIGCSNFRTNFYPFTFSRHFYPNNTSLTGSTVSSFSVSFSDNQMSPLVFPNCVRKTAGALVDEEFESGQDITIYPVPAHDVLNIKMDDLSGNATISIIDMTGRLMVNDQSMSITNGEISIPLDSWENGVYTLTVKQDSKVVQSNFVISN